MNSLNSVPFEVYVIVFIGCITLLLGIACVLRLTQFGHALSSWLFAIIAGACVSYPVVNLPYILVLLEDFKQWPLLRIWPYWGSSSGPFTCLLISAVVAFLFGWVFMALRLKIKKKRR